MPLRLQTLCPTAPQSGSIDPNYWFTGRWQARDSLMSYHRLRLAGEGRAFLSYLVGQNEAIRQVHDLCLRFKGMMKDG